MSCPCRGASDYKSLCLSCHGSLGDGDGPSANSLLERPSNLFSELNSWFKTENGLINTVLKGEGSMPALGEVLSKEGVKDIFACIKTINE
ncbi:cytochrome c [Vibrio amylolyticus]|uniref:c-type cytochrome n=1 Tax=Vibrio amylolyticus TaxID=2847292 RepID=UPI0035503B17